MNLVGGELDMSTPPEHARRELLPSLVNGAELTLKNLGHFDMFYVYPVERDKLLVDFYGVRQSMASIRHIGIRANKLYPEITPTETVFRNSPRALPMAITV